MLHQRIAVPDHDENNTEMMLKKSICIAGGGPLLVLLQAGRVERPMPRHNDKRRLAAVDGRQLRVKPQPLLAAHGEVRLR